MSKYSLDILTRPVKDLTPEEKVLRLKAQKAADQWYEWNVTDWVEQRKAAGDPYVTLVLKGVVGMEAVAFFNSDEAADGNTRPRLIVTPAGAAAGNNSPVANDAAFSVAENAVNGAAVGTYAATDPDPGQTLTYAITAGNADGAFAINPSSGQITVADATKLDHETTPTRALTVSATDCVRHLIPPFHSTGLR